MGRILKIILILVATVFSAAVVSNAQSGRQRPDAKKSERTEDKALDIRTAPKPERSEEAEEIIRINSGLVSIPVTVTDGGGQQVLGLSAADFILNIDGQDTEIDEFTTADSPVKIAFLLDNSSSLISARNFERRASSRFLQTVLRPGTDAAALFSVSTEWKIEHPLVSDVSRLVRAIERMPPPTGATALLDAIMGAVEFLKKEDGRKIIVIISDGEDTVSDTPFNDLLKTLQSTSIQVFVIKTTAYENFKRTGSRVISENIRQLTAERRVQEMVTQTGGESFSPVDDQELEVAFQSIALELSRQYVLGYYPGVESEGTIGFRRIAVRIREGADYRIRTRAGYLGPR
jgi:Ca-activated chloride channel family protein